MRSRVACSVAFAFALSACAEEQGSVFVRGVVPLSAASECVVKAGGEVFSSNGVLDIGPNAPRNYLAAVEVVTNLPATFSTQDVSQAKTQSPNYPNYGNGDSNVIIFDSADINYEFLDRDGNPATQVGQRTALGGSLFNTQTSLSSKAILAVEAVSVRDSEYFFEKFGDLLAVPGATRRVVANIQVRGTTTGRALVEAFPFPFPIDLCVDCLFVNETNCVDGNGNPGTVVPTVDGFCRAGQDVPNALCALP